MSSRADSLPTSFSNFSQSSPDIVMPLPAHIASLPEYRNSFWFSPAFPSSVDTHFSLPESFPLFSSFVPTSGSPASFTTTVSNTGPISVPSLYSPLDLSVRCSVISDSPTLYPTVPKILPSVPFPSYLPPPYAELFSQPQSLTRFSPDSLFSTSTDTSSVNTVTVSSSRRRRSSSRVVKLSSTCRFLNCVTQCPLSAPTPTRSLSYSCCQPRTCPTSSSQFLPSTSAARYHPYPLSFSSRTTYRSLLVHINQDSCNNRFSSYFTSPSVSPGTASLCNISTASTSQHEQFPTLPPPYFASEPNNSMSYRWHTPTCPSPNSSSAPSSSSVEVDTTLMPYSGIAPSSSSNNY